MNFHRFIIQRRGPGYIRIRIRIPIDLSPVRRLFTIFIRRYHYVTILYSYLNIHRLKRNITIT